MYVVVWQFIADCNLEIIFCCVSIELLQVDAVLYDRLPMLAELEKCGSTAESVQSRLCDVGGLLEVGKAFDVANFAVAMPMGGELNEAISNALQLLFEGESIFRYSMLPDARTRRFSTWRRTCLL